MKPDPGSHLRDVDRTAAEIVDFVAGTDLDGFLGNRVLRRAVERDLEIIGEALNRLERDFPNVAARLPDLPKVVGLRNRIAHGYDAVVPETVWNAAVNHLPGLRRSVRSLLAELDRGVPAPDPRHADAVLVLSCAVSERVDSASPVHRDTLPAEIEEILRASERAGDVSRDETGTLARRIARARAETDLRVAAAREVDEGEHFEIKARFEGDPGYAEKDLGSAADWNGHSS